MAARKTNAFIALSGAAMSLPAIAATQPVESTLSLKASSYKESDISGSDVLSGDEDRYDIDIGQFKLVTPVGNSWSLGFDFTKESMSGASPWGTFSGLNGEPALIMSGATIRESRTEVSVSATHYQEASSVTIALSSSDEDDYDARAISIGTEWDFNQKLSTLSLGFSYSSDDLAPSEAPLFGRIEKADKQSRSVSLGWSQIVNSRSVVYAGLSLTQHDGFLTDPYKLRDVRPDERTEWALSLKYRRFFDNQNAALHLDYRYFDDDWGVNSHTVYAAWYQNFGASFKLAPNVRLYSQSEADFYLEVDNFARPLTVDQSSDFRLSGYGAYTLGIKAIYAATQWDVSVSIDRYSTAGINGHSASSPDHPALLKFTLASIGFNYRF